MPFKSEKQRRLMYAAAAGKVEDISPETATRYIAHSTGKRKLKAKRKGNSR